MDKKVVAMIPALNCQSKNPNKEIADRIIISGASECYADSLLALMGSLRVNWPDHPPVRVYDLGMSPASLARLAAANIEVREVPAFCPHWRKYFAWKLWCFADVPAATYLWIDAGACVLRPMPEAFACSEALGYFCSTNHFSLCPQTSAAQELAMGISAAQLEQMVSINSGIHALRKDIKGNALLHEALDIALSEQNMRPTMSLHRHDQPLLTGLIYKFFGQPLFADFKTYAGWQGPNEVLNQKIWVHRRRMLVPDMAYFHRALHEELPPHIPAALPAPRPVTAVMRLRIRMAKWRGRYPLNKAGEVIYDGVKD